MSVERPFEVTPCCRHGVPITDLDAANCAYYESLFEWGTHRVTDGPGTPRDSSGRSGIQADTGEDGRTNSHS
jgi:hypothetical protein